jgi:hypothetical protein
MQLSELNACPSTVAIQVLGIAVAAAVVFWEQQQHTVILHDELIWWKKGGMHLYSSVQGGAVNLLSDPIPTI